METVNNFMEEHFCAPIQSNGHSKGCDFSQSLFQKLGIG